MGHVKWIRSERVAVRPKNEATEGGEKNRRLNGHIHSHTLSGLANPFAVKAVGEADVPRPGVSRRGVQHGGGTNDIHQEPVSGKGSDGKARDAGSDAGV